MINKNLKCNDFYFYPDGEFRNVARWDSELYCFDNDIKEVSSRIRIFGTQKQIDKAFDDYANITGLNLDECYTYQIEKKGTFFYNEKDNEKIAKKLIEYEKLYNQINEKALILRIR